MKILSLLVLLLSLSCAKKEQTNPVESSWFTLNNEQYFAYNPGADEKVVIESSSGQLSELPFPARFFYFLNHQETLYVFYQEHGAIYFRTSQNLSDWSAPTLSLSPESSQSIYNQLWNVAVQVDAQGKWHLLVECSDSTPNQSAVGLSYMVSSGPVFESSKTHFMDIVGGGNPELKVLPEGLVSIHGQIVNGHWEIHYSSFIESWSKPKTFFKEPLIHVADPNVIETPQGLKMSYSYDQNSIRYFETTSTYADLFQQAQIQQ